MSPTIEEPIEGIKRAIAETEAQREALAPGQDLIFSSYNFQPGQSCKVYTNEYHPESYEFSFGSGTANWNNNGDCGYLYNRDDILVDDHCY